MHSTIHAAKHKTKQQRIPQQSASILLHRSQHWRCPHAAAPWRRQQTRIKRWMLLKGQTDRQTPDRYIDPAPQTMQAASIKVSKVKCTDLAKFAGHLPHRYGNSHAVWDHTVLPATRQRWHSRLYPSRSWYSIKRPRRDARLSWPSSSSPNRHYGCCE